MINRPKRRKLRRFLGSIPMIHTYAEAMAKSEARSMVVQTKVLTSHVLDIRF